MNKRSLRPQIDVRTDTMPPQVLLCRSMNHPWQRVPVPASRRTELLRDGLVEWHWHCLRCGSSRIDLFELPDFTTVRSNIRYCSDYLMPSKHKGTGRLPRNAARRAMYVRDDPSLA